VRAIPATPQDLESRFNVSRESVEKLSLLVAELLNWQQRINLIAPSTIDAVWERHVADSLQLLFLLPGDTKQIADLGSGAGFPGLVLACARPWTVHLYEANNKKAAFLQEMLRLTGAQGKVHWIRLETLASLAQLPVVTAVTARALAPLPTLLDLSAPFLNRGATGYFHKGAEAEDELTQARKSPNVTIVKHPSLIDSRSVILEVKSNNHVDS
jgi:16S rRNA (guanine527-N7)-methyltransferase